MSSESENLIELLEQLNDEKQSIPFSKLYPFSDLSRKQQAEFRLGWEDLPAETRRRLAHALAEFAEATFEVNFDAIFRIALEDADNEVRATAIDGLWENEELDLIGPFLAMLRNDPSPRVRASAASGLGRYVLAGELEKLAQPVQNRIMTELLTVSLLAGESIDVRRRAVESASYACTPEVRDMLEMAYYDEDEKMRISAVVGMGRSCDQQWKPIILEELESSSPAMRYEAAWASGELVLRQAVPSLARLIYDPDRQVSNAAIWALGQIGGQPAKQILTNAYDDADEDTANAIDDALAELALTEGELDLALYDFSDEEEDELLEDEFVTLWDDDGDEEDEDFGPDDDWDPDDF
jgi:HEAT repeat protein